MENRIHDQRPKEIPLSTRRPSRNRLQRIRSQRIPKIPSLTPKLIRRREKNLPLLISHNKRRPTRRPLPLKLVPILNPLHLQSHKMRRRKKRAVTLNRVLQRILIVKMRKLRKRKVPRVARVRRVKRVLRAPRVPRVLKVRRVKRARRVERAERVPRVVARVVRVAVRNQRSSSPREKRQEVLTMQWLPISWQLPPPSLFSLSEMRVPYHLFASYQNISGNPRNERRIEEEAIFVWVKWFIETLNEHIY